jgi:hypothetical protein
LTITRCRQLWHWTSSERTPFWRMLAKSIGSIGSFEARMRHHHRPSRARRIAGLSGFFILIRSLDGPERYGAVERRSHPAECNDLPFLKPELTSAPTSSSG